MHSLIKAMSVRKPDAKTIFIGTGLLLSAVLLYFSLRHVNYEELKTILGRVSWFWLFVSLCVAISHGFVMARKWQLVLRDFTKKMSFFDAFWSLRLANFFNALLPARLGEAVRLIFIKLRTNIGIGRSLGALAADRAFDLVALVSLAGLGFLWVQGDTGSWNFSYMLLFALGLVGALLVICFLPLHWLINLRIAFLGRALDFVGNVQTGIKNLFQRNLLLEMSFWALFAWSVQVTLLLCVAQSFEFQIYIYEAILVVTAVSFAVALPSAPGNFGTFEFAAIFVLHKLLGHDLESSVFVTLVYHLVQYLQTLAIGGLGVLLYRKTLFGHWSEIKRVGKVTPDLNEQHES